MNQDIFQKRKKTVYNLICDDMYVPMKIKELAIVLNVKKEERPELEQILNELLAEGKISLSKRGKYTKSEEKQVVGTFTAHAKGFGFVTIEGEEEDIFIPETGNNIYFYSHIMQRFRLRISNRTTNATTNNSNFL